jgi:hypothetical protein
MRHPGRDPEAQVARGSQQPSPANAAAGARHVRQHWNLLNADPAFDVVYAVRPRSAMAWRLADHDGSQHRWPGD